MFLNSVQSFVIENCNGPTIENGLNNVCLHPLSRTFTFLFQYFQTYSQTEYLKACINCWIVVVVVDDSAVYAWFQICWRRRRTAEWWVKHTNYFFRHKNKTKNARVQWKKVHISEAVQQSIYSTKYTTHLSQRISNWVSCFKSSNRVPAVVGQKWGFSLLRISRRNV